MNQMHLVLKLIIRKTKEHFMDGGIVHMRLLRLIMMLL